MITIHYRILAAQDLAAYRQIRLECLQNYPDFFGSDYASEVQSTTLKFDKALNQTDLNSFLYGAFAGTELVGICGFTKGNRPKIAHRGEITHMFVKSNRAGQGIGKQLLLHTIDKAMNDMDCDLLTLGVVDTNTAAKALYEKIGFVKYGFLPRYYKQGGRYFGMIEMMLTKHT
jgi:ribosomal protein S18 acetylase RimI-like enzyme